MRSSSGQPILPFVINYSILLPALEYFLNKEKEPTAFDGAVSINENGLLTIDFNRLQNVKDFIWISTNSQTGSIESDFATSAAFFFFNNCKTILMSEFEQSANSFPLMELAAKAPGVVTVEFSLKWDLRMAYEQFRNWMRTPTIEALSMMPFSLEMESVRFLPSRQLDDEGMEMEVGSLHDESTLNAMQTDQYIRSTPEVASAVISVEELPINSLVNLPKFQDTNTFSSQGGQDQGEGSGTPRQGGVESSLSQFLDDLLEGRLMPADNQPVATSFACLQNTKFAFKCQAPNITNPIEIAWQAIFPPLNLENEFPYEAHRYMDKSNSLIFRLNPKTMFSVLDGQVNTEDHKVQKGSNKIKEEYLPFYAEVFEHIKFTSEAAIQYTTKVAFKKKEAEIFRAPSLAFSPGASFEMQLSFSEGGSNWKDNYRDFCTKLFGVLNERAKSEVVPSSRRGLTF